MTRTASLGMYDGPAVQAANDALWALVAERLAQRGIADVPPSLDRGRSLDDIWSDSGLLLAQCCGYPLATRYRGRLRYVATPRYAAPGCSGALYRSRIVVRADDPAERMADLRGRTAAVNEWHSNSGMNVFRATVAPLARDGQFFARVIATGSHGDSSRAVAEGEADVAAIDAVSFAHIAAHQPALARRLRTIGWSEATPGLPFVTSPDTPDGVVRSLQEVLGDVLRSDAARPAREALLLEGIECLTGGAYDRLLAIERTAIRHGYPTLA